MAHRHPAEPVATAARGALDPDELWHAWARGERAGVDTFTQSWSPWEHAARPLDELRAVWHIGWGA